MAYPRSRNINRLNFSRRALAGSLADQIWRYLRTAIIRGEIPPGTRLVELQIAAEMGTSQGPVREALQRLEQDGLVERRARSATIVTEVPDEDIYELISVRSLVEQLAARRTAAKITADQCAELWDLVEQMRQCAQQGDRMALEDLNLDFHRRICEWSGNPILLRVWLPIATQIQRLVAKRPADHVSDLEGFVETHVAVVTALSTQDGAKAAEAIRLHIEHAWSLLAATEPAARLVVAPS
jgi:DNA-binding GntR family transcriptional regulator